MSRRLREQAVLELIEDHVIQNQGQLVSQLQSQGIPATQATVSRDVKRLGLIKRPARGGGYRYASPGDFSQAGRRGQRQLRNSCQQFLTKIDTGEALLILKTLSGRANALAVALDESNIAEIAGTLAGDDTILVITRKKADRAKVQALLEDMVG